MRVMFYEIDEGVPKCMFVASPDAHFNPNEQQLKTPLNDQKLISIDGHCISTFGAAPALQISQ